MSVHQNFVSIQHRSSVSVDTPSEKISMYKTTKEQTYECWCACGSQQVAERAPLVRRAPAKSLKQTANIHTRTGTHTHTEKWVGLYVKNGTARRPETNRSSRPHYDEKVLSNFLLQRKNTRCDNVSGAILQRLRA